MKSKDVFDDVWVISLFDYLSVGNHHCGHYLLCTDYAKIFKSGLF